MLLSIQSLQAGSATWTGAISSDWNDARNWSPETVPGNDAGTDIATFGASTRTGVLLSTFSANVASVSFGPSASGYTITVGSPFTFGDLGFNGVGIVNNSGLAQNFFLGSDGGIGPLIAFSNSATAGDSTPFTLDNDSAVEFWDISTAGSGNFTINGALCDGCHDVAITFNGSATAGDGTFVCDGSAFGNNGGGAVTFLETSSAGNSSLTAKGGSNDGFGGAFLFSGDAADGTARVKIFGNGNLDISTHNVPGVTFGSLEGTGNVFLAGNNLVIGSNNLSKTFSGVIQDEGGFVNGSGGSLTKVGSGTLTLFGANTYTGVTTVSTGTLLVTTKPSSGTGTNKLKVNAGTLGGTGTVGGAVTVGTGRGPGAFLAPGTTSTGTLTFKRL